MTEKGTVIIIGAGAAGLMAARELSRAGREVIVLEARNRMGGRIQTYVDKSTTARIEAGAEFVHGKLETTRRLLKEYKIKSVRAKGKVVHLRHDELQPDNDFVGAYHQLIVKKLKSLKGDMPVAQFLKKYFAPMRFATVRQAVIGFVEGYESASIDHFSTFAFRKDFLEAEEWKQYRVEGGYGTLMDALAADCKARGCSIKLSSVVTSINWKKNAVTVKCANGKHYSAQQAVIAVSLGILRDRTIQFSPVLMGKQKALGALGYGDVIKIQLLFKAKFWAAQKLQERLDQHLDKLFFLFSHAPVPTWWTQYPADHALLTGWLSGSKAKMRAARTNKEIADEALESLAVIFDTDKKALKSKLKTAKVFNWSTDPFTRGSYSYATVNAAGNISKVASPLKDTLFFAGEYLEEPVGTVEAALRSGLRVAELIIKGKE